MTTPLLRMTGLRRDYPAGAGLVTVLKDVDLEIEAGEFVAIVGASGSGKSTLMNILGCLDRPSAGTYFVDGRPTDKLTSDELAALRRERFGFIFQRYHLLSDLSALGNAEVPAIYAGGDPAARRERAEALLARLGLGDRLRHRPGQLSGGQQQRVSIARALVNGGAVILADEPTGALDKASGEEVMRILARLNAEGHTIILVTHDATVAAHARRLIEISDGIILSDRRTSGRIPMGGTLADPGPRPTSPWRALAGRFGEALRMALIAMKAQRMRTLLTMLGIIIGIASVVSVVGLGKGAREQVMAQISELGANTIDIFPGRDFGDPDAASIESLTEADAAALSRESYVDSVTPNVSRAVTARHRNIVAASTVSGVGADYFHVRGLRLAAGRLFDSDASRTTAQVAVIDTKARAALFPGRVDPLGKTILLDMLPVRVIGVLKPATAEFGSSPTIYVPYGTAAVRLVGKTDLDSITVRVNTDVSSRAAQEAITRLLTRRHRFKDFSIFNSDQFRKAISSASQTLTLLISGVAVISLLVGGIGVMNIMLVSVTERTPEIGVRMAVGARQSDILQQFLIEAVLVCVIGGAIGVLLALAIGPLLNLMGGGFRVAYSLPSILFAFACSTGIGVLFGFLPARNAARLDPVEALARD
ncbi:MAG: MacB family efflux pump subunit [Rhodospirillum sp.]|nr:MacB family efflux pump subunit [Rhodospirillum sp.]MCF8491445.1 MacB family efflux pump subunit [Rhodospirillum sp.]